ncbi:MAG: Rrf2 family transcriptional regulator [Phycisphaerae bacterium]|jgi:Rrf2 family protein
MISQTAEYALRAVVCLASRPADALTTQQIAAVTKVPAGYLSKVLQALGRAGLVTSQRGLHGGFALARPAGQVNVLEVINAVDPVKRIEKCPLDLAAHGVKLCPLHRRLDDAIGQMEKAFRESVIAELIEEDAATRPLDLVFPGCIAAASKE